MVPRGGAVLIPLGVPVQVATPGYDVTAVRLPARRVRQAAEDTTGVPGARLRFHAMSPVSPAMLRYWRGVSALAAGALADENSPLDSPLLAEDLARTAATAVLHTFPNSTMTRQHQPAPGRVAPAAVRRAEAFLEEHADRPVRLAEVAAAAGTSARALQHAFRRHRGTTPLGHLRRVRLERARRELQAADPTAGVTVAAVAVRWGFATQSGFTAAYRTAFDETPSQTLRT